MLAKTFVAALIGALSVAVGALAALAGPTWENFTYSGNAQAISVNGNTVWVGTSGGLIEWNVTTGEFVRHLAPEGFPDNSVAAVAVDAQGRPWIGLATWNGGLSVLDGERWRTRESEKGLPTDWVTALTIDSAGRKWIGTVRGLAVLEDGTNPADTSDDVWATFRKTDGLIDEGVNGIAVDAVGRVWCATSHGLGVLNWGGTLEDKSDDVWASFTASDGLVNDVAYGVAVDAEGRIWVACRGGVSVLDLRGTLSDKTDDVWASFTSAESLPKGDAHAIAFDAVGRAWVGGSFGLCALDGAATPLDRSDDVVTRFTAADGLPSTTVRALAVDAAGAVWCACLRGGVGRLDAGGTTADKADDVWTTFAVVDWLPTSDVTGLRIEGDVVWVGTSGGLVAYGLGEGALYAPSSVIALARDAAGVLWIAGSSGLAALSDGGTPLDPSDDVLTLFDKRDGLIATALRGMSLDAAGRVWCATASGVSVLDPGGTPHDKADDRWASFTTADGMAADWGNAIVAEGDRLVWVVHEGASISVLDDGGTPFDKADDAWATYGAESPIGIRSGYTVVIDAAGLKWFGLCDGVWVFDDGGTPLDSADDNWLRFDIGDCNPGIAIDELGRKWIATGWTGVTMLDDSGTPFDASDDIQTSYTIAGGLIDDRIQAIAVGGGVVWIAADGGLSRLTP